MKERKKKSPAQLGRVDVERKAMRIEDLSDKVNVAVSLFNKAQHKFESGKDSRREWKQIITLLGAETKNINHFIAVANHNIGVIHAGQRDLDKAKEWFLKAIQIDDDYAMAYYNLAVTYKELGDMRQAKKYYALALEKGYTPPKSKC